MMDWLLAGAMFILFIMICMWYDNLKNAKEAEDNSTYSSFVELYSEWTTERLEEELKKLYDEYEKITEQAHAEFIRDYNEDPIDILGFDRTYNYKKKINKIVTFKYHAILEVLSERERKFKERYEEQLKDKTTKRRNKKK